jgi:hypothetical protein
MNKAGFLFCLLLVLCFNGMSQKQNIFLKCDTTENLFYYYSSAAPDHKVSCKYLRILGPSDSLWGFFGIQDRHKYYEIIGDSVFYDRSSKRNFFSWLSPAQRFRITSGFSFRADPNLIVNPEDSSTSGKIEFKFNPIALYFYALAMCKFTDQGFRTHPRRGCPSLEIDTSIVNTITFVYDSVNDLRINGSVIDNCYFSESVIRDVDMSGDCNGLYFSDSKLLKNPKLFFASPPAALGFSRCDLSDLQGYIDLTHIFDNHLVNKIRLYLHGTDVSKVRFNYRDFTIVLDDWRYDEKQILYKVLKDQYEKLGMRESYMLADIDAQNLEYDNGNWFNFVSGRISWWWWHFGYDKSRVLKNSAILFIIFFGINLLVGLPNLLSKGYPIKKIPTQNIWWRKFIYTFLFTGIVFWGINLDKKTLNLEHLRYVFYILLQYLVGLICLAYLANFIISK